MSTITKERPASPSRVTRTGPRRGKPETGGAQADAAGASALYLTEMLAEINMGAGFLDRLTNAEIAEVRRAGHARSVGVGEAIFTQGCAHSGIYLIEAGRVRTYYSGPNGREITLAYWTPGHFVGGPEIFGGVHMWSAGAVEPSRLLQIAGPRLRRIAETMPGVAMCLIDGLVAKGKCYSALVQMLGTRSVTERLAHLLLILAEVRGRPVDSRPAIDRDITHEHIANMVGSTRQWVTTTLARFQRDGLIAIDRDRIFIDDPAGLRSVG